jgi:hypothetical protein
MLTDIPISKDSLQRLANADCRALEAGLDAGRAVIALTILEREQILPCPDDQGLEELAEPRAVLLKEYEGPVRESLV